jgi:hypothetical protein
MNRYASIRTSKTTDDNIRSIGIVYDNTNFYPEIPLDPNDIYVITDFGDRLDLLANQFYKDVTLYWIIAAANPDAVSFDSLFITQGTQLRIPTNINAVLNSYNQLNSL